MNEDKAYKGCGWSVVAAVVLLLVMLLSSCRTKEVQYVTVPEVHEIHHHHTDSIRETDSILHEKETIVMQLDSAEMAKYGIRLKQAENAWLVKTKELEREIEKLITQKTDSTAKRDSIPYPVYVPKEVSKPLSWWQRLRMHVGGVAVWLLIGAAIYGGWKFYKSIRK